MPYRVTERGERRRQEMRERILDAAQDLFVEQGYQHTSLRQVVQRAGTSIGNLYFYFPGKEALLRAVAQRVSDEVSSVVDRAMASVDPVARPAVAVYAGLRWALERLALARVVLLEVPHISRPVALGHFADRIGRFLAGSPQALDGRHPELVTQVWLGSMFQVLEAATAGVVQAPAQVVARFVAEWNLAGLGLPGPTRQAALAGLDEFISSHEEGQT
jgi:AcrR family transcriptional regulator